MRLFVTALNSGSSGNCYYIGNEEEAILVDAGISCREIEQRMKRLELSMKKVKAVFISHEHTDHIKGVRVLSKKYKLPVYITQKTLDNSFLETNNPLLIRLISEVPVKVGTMIVTAFAKHHDAGDPQSFIVESGNTCVGVFTDIGSVCDHVINYLKRCHGIFLETNYDEQMLAQGTYPYFLKRRITGGKGHLSNNQALQLLKQHKPDFLSHIFLSHLSEENNHPDLVYNLFKASFPKSRIILTSRTSEIPVFVISPDGREHEKDKNLQTVLQFN